MISSKYRRGGFFMSHKVYTAEYKMQAINEYLTSDFTLRNYVKEKDICLSTFVSWLTKYRKASNPVVKKSNPLMPIDVTDEAKAIIKKEIPRSTERIKLELDGMKLTFPINCLKEVLEVIRNG